MIAIAPLLQAFFTDRLARQRRASPHTVAAYRDTFRLLFAFAEQRLGKSPTELTITDLDAQVIGDFLHHLEAQRHNSIRTRNARLAAIRSFCQYASQQEPACLESIRRVLAIPQKRFDRHQVDFLTPNEVTALLEAVDRQTWLGQRDYTLLVLAIESGMRVSELTALRCRDIVLGTGAHVRCQGKGRKERCTPMTNETARTVAAWRQQFEGRDDAPLFPSLRGGQLSSDALQRLVAKYVKVARQQTPSLRDKKVTPHVLRHTAAVRLLQAGVDRAVIALWLGHEQLETTQIYLAADLSMKERALARTAPITSQAGRYRPSDPLLAFLQSL